MLLSSSKASLCGRLSRSPTSFAFATFSQLSSKAADSKTKGSTTTQVEKGEERKSLKRFYLRQGKWDSQRDLLIQLRKDVVYFDPVNDKHGLVAINKPYGLPLKKQEDSQYSFEEMLPLLQTALEVPELFIIKVPERFSTGLALLGTKKSTVERVMKCRRRAVQESLLVDKYLAITDAFPRMNKAMETVYMLMKKIDVREPIFGEHHKEPVLSRTIPSKRFLQRQLEGARRVHVFSEVLRRSGCGKSSLVAIEPSKITHLFLSVYMSDLLSPILGDHFYSYRSRPLMGVMTKVGHEMSPHTMQQMLPDWMMRNLGLERGEEYVVPKHVHLMRSYLPGFLGKSKHLTLFAPPPKYFQETAERLQIKIDVQEIFDSDSIRNWRKVRVEKQDENAVETTHVV